MLYELITSHLELKYKVSPKAFDKAYSGFNFSELSNEDLYSLEIVIGSILLNKFLVNQVMKHLKKFHDKILKEKKEREYVYF